MISKKILKTIIFIAVLVIFALKSFAQVSGAGAIMAIDERNLGAVGRSGSPVSVATARTEAKPRKVSSGKNPSSAKTVQVNSPKATQTSTKKATSKSPTPKKYDGFVIGDKYTFFNFEIVKAAQPIHTIAAQDAGAKGLVQVEILIGENGKVLEARARSGNKLLHPEAERAALSTVFNKPAVYGKPARAFGFIVFRFGERED